MTCAAPAARPRAGLRALILSLSHPRRLARRINDGHVLAGRAVLLVLALALLAAQIEVHAHALSHLAEPTRAATNAAANGASPGDEDGRHVGAVCLECLALAALDLPPAAPKSFTCDDDGTARPPIALPPAPSSSTPGRPRCRAPPSSALRHIAH
jgi:hypothetical protein